MQIITAETKSIAPSSSVVLCRVTLSVFFTRSIRLGAQGYLLLASQMPEQSTTENRLLILEHFENFVARDSKIWAGFAQSIQGVPQLLPTIYPHSFNWIECKSHCSAEPDTEVISISISSVGPRTNFPSPCPKCNLPENLFNNIHCSCLFEPWTYFCQCVCNKVLFRKDGWICLSAVEVFRFTTSLFLLLFIFNVQKCAKCCATFPCWNPMFPKINEWLSLRILLNSNNF